MDNIFFLDAIFLNGIIRNAVNTVTILLITLTILLILPNNTSSQLIIHSCHFNRRLTLLRQTLPLSHTKRGPVKYLGCPSSRITPGADN